MKVPRVLDTAPASIGNRSYVLESFKVLYISAPKNACTSLRWLIAELAGEDLSRFRAGLSPLLNTEDAIHRRALFQRTPRLGDVEPEVLRTISPDNGWFVFGVIRDPRSRLFSAWQNKFLMHTPDYMKWRDADWYPKLPDSAEDIARDFARFVELLHTEPNHPLAADGHFCAQTRLLRTDAIPYSRIYDVSEIRTLLADLTEHLRAHGLERELTLRQTNDTPLRANARVLAEPVKSRIEQIYAGDFAKFGHVWDYSRIEKVNDWTPSAVQELRARTLLHDRIGELLVRARDEWRRAQAAEQQLERANQSAPGATQRAVRAEQRLKQAQQRLDRANKRIAELENMRSTRAGLAARRLRGRLRNFVRR